MRRHLLRVSRKMSTWILGLAIPLFSETGRFHECGKWEVESGKRDPEAKVI